LSKEVSISKKMGWLQLAFLGLGFTSGTGFFLGSAIAIERSGFSVLILFLLAAITTYFVFDALARMIVQHEEEGSFRAYSNNAFGHWAGFSHGWLYWSSEMLIMGSQLTALGLFTQYWFTDIPLWIFATGYATLGVIIVILGTKGFEKTENILAVIKIAAIVMFIILACLVIPGVLGEKNAHMHDPKKMEHFFTHGFMGLWTALLYVFFAFSGIEIMGLMATDLRNRKDAPKSGKLMISIITFLFVLSIGLAMLLAPLEAFNTHESPFITALKDLQYSVIIHIFNGILIIAGFSCMVASLYSVTRMMYSISKDGDAPRILSKKSKSNLPYVSLILTVCGMILSIVIALLLPNKVYEYITTAGGLMLLYTWLFIVFAARKLLKLSAWGHVKSYIAIIIICIAASGTLFDKTNRPGFFASLIFIAVIGGVAIMMRKKWKKEQRASQE
jgi:L-asparagine transporter-like permease